MRFRIPSMLVVLVLLLSGAAGAANHREAPLTALDHKADIADFFAFVSFDDPTKVTFILTVDPLLEPSNGPNYFPFDPEIAYTVKVDNDFDAVKDVAFRFRFKTEIRAPGVFTGLVGAGGGVPAPANSPAPVAPGTPIVPPGGGQHPHVHAAGAARPQALDHVVLQEAQELRLHLEAHLGDLVEEEGAAVGLLATAHVRLGALRPTMPKGSSPAAAPSRWARRRDSRPTSRASPRARRRRSKSSGLVM